MLFFAATFMVQWFIFLLSHRIFLEKEGNKSPYFMPSYSNPERLPLPKNYPFLLGIVKCPHFATLPSVGPNQSKHHRGSNQGPMETPMAEEEPMRQVPWGKTTITTVKCSKML